MAISSLTQLRAAARDWSKRQSVGDATWDDMVTMSEVALNNGEKADDGSYLTLPLRVRQMETVATITVTDGAGQLPDDFLELINVRNPGEVTSSLDYVTSEYMANRYPTGQPSSNPANYNIIGSTLYCPIDTEIAYYARIPSLVADQTNWLLSAAPNVYLFGVLAFYSIYDKHPEAVAGYRSLRDNALGGLGYSDINSRAGSFTRRASMPAF